MSVRRVTGRQVLAALLAFFTLVFAANGLFVYLALGSWSGLEVEHPYTRGRAYQQALDDAHAQAARGWRLALRHETLGGGRIRLVADLTDAHGQPIDGVTLRAQIRRPAVDAFDQNIVLAPQGQGRYAAVVALAGAGQWDVRLESSGHPGVPQRQHARLWVRP
ncbi:MAG: hypothetical protein D6782_05200 [Alphaproteobacteria bacterium]|nr:MAG: hypothetical protein D6782_05200 [Alphaproteobacteria bacterium]